MAHEFRDVLRWRISTGHLSSRQPSCMPSLDWQNPCLAFDRALVVLSREKVGARESERSDVEVPWAANGMLPSSAWHRSSCRCCRGPALHIQVEEKQVLVSLATATSVNCPVALAHHRPPTAVPIRRPLQVHNSRLSASVNSHNTPKIMFGP